MCDFTPGSSWRVTYAPLIADLLLGMLMSKVYPYLWWTPYTMDTYSMTENFYPLNRLICTKIFGLKIKVHHDRYDHYDDHYDHILILISIYWRCIEVLTCRLIKCYVNTSCLVKCNGLSQFYTFTVFYITFYFSLYLLLF